MNRALLVHVMLGLTLSCKEREPYPSAPPSRGPDAGPGEAPAEPVPLAAVVTPEGSFLVAGRPDGNDLDVRMVSGLVHVRQDGTLARFEVARETQRPHGRDTPESVFVTLTWRTEGPGGGTARTLFPLDDQKRPDLKRLAAADPDLASLYYHREGLWPLGVFGSLFSWVVKVEGFLGGAHPYSEARLLTVDAESGQPADLRGLFQTRDVEAEALKGVKPDECVRRFAGVAGAEGIGGKPVFAAMLVHEFEVCRGKTRLVPLAPVEQGPPRPLVPVRLDAGVLQSEGGDLRVPGVVDFRASPHGHVVVMLMSLGPQDRAPSPLSEPSERSKSREVRLWVKGRASPLVLGRATRLLCVQFLMDHPAAQAVLDAFRGL